jgi:hypothetical protein
MFDYGTISDEIEAIKDKVDEYVAEYKAQVLQESQDTFDMMIKEFETNTPKIVAMDELYSLKISDSDVDMKSNVISLGDSLDEYVIEYNDKYEITHTEDGKIVIKRKKIIYPKTIGECYEIMNMDYTEFNFSENPSNEEREIYSKLALLRSVIVARNAYWKRLNWKPDWDDASQVKYCVTHSTPAFTNNSLQYYQTTSIKCVVCMPDSESRQDFCDKFGATMNEIIEFI